jgi:hypothetical protein
MAIILTDGLVLLDGATPLNHPRVCYQTWTRGITPTVSSTASGFYAGALANSLTNEYWSPSSSVATIQYDFGQSRSIDYVAVGAHTLGTTASTVVVAYSIDDITYTDLPDFIAADNSAVVILFEAVDARYVRITITYAAAAPVVSVVYAGLSLAMQRAIYGGHSPVTLSRDTTAYSQVSASGQWLGRSTVRRGLKTSASFRHLTAAWCRSYLDPFAKSARNYPYFFGWNPSQFPAEVALCWSNSDITPTNMGIRDLMEVSFDINGFGATE